MAGIFQNLRLTSERNDMDAPASNAYETTTASTNVAQSSTEQITQPNPLTVQAIPQGFGAYLDGILPPDIAKAAGSFSVSMQQIKNISSVPIEKFAQVVNSLETNKNLNVNGTSVPTDTTLATQGLALIALGNGPYGTYTMSNFLGCMSGLPYLGIDIDGLIKNVQTTTLSDIYKNIYLAVTWERATATIQYTGPDGFGNYTTTGVTLTNPGGGYATAPIVTVNGATVTATIGADDTQVFPSVVITAGNFIVGKTYTISSVGSTNFTLIGAGSNTVGVSFVATGIGTGTGTANDITTSTFGRITGLNFISGTTGSVPTISIAYPPGGIESPPSSGIFIFNNSNVQGYIQTANDEIAIIKNSQPALAQQLITNWELTGTLLSVEQRAIATGMTIGVPNSSPSYLREPTIAAFPSTQYAFVDSIPRYATFTQPHMYSQTLEAIANYNTVGGRSIVAMLRESRNQARLQEAGIPVDNNIANKLTKQQESELIANGILGGSVPATLATEIGSPVPFGYYDPVDDRYYSDGVAIDIGEAVEPGSFAGSRYSNLIPPQLSVIYASDILLPATYSVQEAIDEVIRCNCDCWDNI